MTVQKNASVTIIIATLDRVDDLRKTLTDLQGGTCLPVEVRVVDASDNNLTRQLCSENWSPLRVSYYYSSIKSAAQQRNLGATGCETDYLLFCDDDVELPPDTLSRFVTVFESDTEQQIGGIAGTIIDYHHRPPGRLLRFYYRLQAGYDHPTYGGHYFGAGINLLPTDRPEDPELYPSQWLNSTLVTYRTPLFHREQFPAFSGYSFQEDVNVSARIGRTHRLHFHRGIRYVHKGSPGGYKSNLRHLAAMQLINRWYNANELLGLGRFEAVAKFTLSQLVDSALRLRNRKPGWRELLIGSWSAWWKLAVLGRKVESMLEVAAQ